MSDKIMERLLNEATTIMQKVHRRLREAQDHEEREFSSHTNAPNVYTPIEVPFQPGDCEVCGDHTILACLVCFKRGFTVYICDKPLCVAWHEHGAVTDVLCYGKQL